MMPALRCANGVVVADAADDADDAEAADADTADDDAAEDDTDGDAEAVPRCISVSGLSLVKRKMWRKNTWCTCAQPRARAGGPAGAA